MGVTRTVCPCSGRTLDASGQEALLGDHRNGQGEQGEQMGGVLLGPLVADLEVTERRRVSE